MIRPVRGMILAAGLGTRLHPLTLFRAKPAVPFLNRPLIHYSLEMLSAAGVREVAINLHHLPETVAAAVESYQPSPHLKTSPLRLQLSKEKEILGTAGGLYPLREFFRGGDIIVSNGKIYFEESLEAALAFHRESQSWVTLVLAPHSGVEPFNPVLMDADKNVLGFALRKNIHDFSQAFIFTGVHILSERILDLLPPGRSETVNDLYPRLLREGLPIRGIVSRAFWCECSQPARYLTKSLEVLQRSGRDNLLDSPIRGNCTGVVAGQNVNVGKGSKVTDSILWDGISIGPACHISNAIIVSGTELPAGAEIDSAVITPLPDRFKENAPPGTFTCGTARVWPFRILNTQG